MVVELDAITSGLAVNQICPSVDGYDRLDATTGGREGIDFFGERVSPYSFATRNAANCSREAFFGTTVARSVASKAAASIPYFVAMVTSTDRRGSSTGWFMGHTTV